jgi:UDP-glucose 4-epimerase
VSDVVWALTRIMENGENSGQVFNLGSDVEVSIAALARRVIELCGSQSIIENISYEKAYGQAFDDLNRRVPKLERIRSAIGFEPRYGLDDVIHAVIAEHRAMPA